MIWHILEIFVLLLVSFVIGCLLGSLLYRALALTPLAAGQEALAGALGGSVDRIKQRFGFAPAWRPASRRRAGARDPNAYYEGPYRDRAERAPSRWPGKSLTGRRRPEPARTFDIEDAVLGPPEDQADEREALDWEDDWASEPERLETTGGELPEIGAEPAFDAETEPHDEAEPTAEGDTDREPEPLPDGAPEPEPEPLPEPEPEPELPSMRPMGLSAPRNGVPDNLQRIRGIGKKNEQLLNSLGIFHISQIAAWTPAEARWVASQIPFPERIERDDWIGQATVLASGGDTEYVKAVARRAEKAAEGSEPDEDDTP